VHAVTKQSLQVSPVRTDGDFLGCQHDPIEGNAGGMGPARFVQTAGVNPHAFPCHQLQDCTAGIGLHRKTRLDAIGVWHPDDFPATGRNRAFIVGVNRRANIPRDGNRVRCSNMAKRGKRCINRHVIIPFTGHRAQPARCKSGTRDTESGDKKLISKDGDNRAHPQERII